MMYKLIKTLNEFPEIPIGFIVGWNVFENGYTGAVKYWFSKSDIEQSLNWEKV